MSENKKEIHIVFQTLNFLFGSQSDNYLLLPIHRLLLIALARHFGVKGIYPAIATLARELKISRRYLKTCLLHLEEYNLIRIDRDRGRSSRYYLDFLSTTEHLQITGDLQYTGELQITTPSIYRSPHRASTDHPINKEEQLKRNNRERAQKKRAPLSDHFLPDEKRNDLLKETALKARKSEEQLLSKFKNLQKSKQGTSADWNAEFENFLINERPAGYLNGNGHANGEVRSTVPFFGPGHPTYDADARIKAKLAEQAAKNIKPVVVIEEKPTEHLSFKEVKRRYELSKQQGELKNVSDAGNSSGGRNSQ